jgi:hypothetical protein
VTGRVLSVIMRDQGAERLVLSAQASGDIEISEEVPALEGWRLCRRVIIHRGELAQILSGLREALRLSVAARPTSDADARELAGIVGPGEVVSLTALGPTPVDALAVDRLRANLKRNEAIGARRAKRRR